MKLTHFSINKPIVVFTCILFVFTLGFVALKKIPVQLTPDIQNPILHIHTDWHGAAPEEVEREIITRQEKELETIKGLKSITSTAGRGKAQIKLVFAARHDMKVTMLEVAHKLQTIKDYPENVDPPLFFTSGTENDALAWYMLYKSPDNKSERAVGTYNKFINDNVAQKIERIDGVGKVNVYGGVDPEIHVILDQKKMANYKITTSEVLRAIRQERVSISAGDVAEGKRLYVLRTKDQLATTDEINNIVIKTINLANSETNEYWSHIYLKDIATVEPGYSKIPSFVRYRAIPSLAIQVQREIGKNVIEVMEEVKKTVKKLNDTSLKEKGLTLVNVYDQTDYIYSSIKLVKQNIYIGGLLAAFVLILFLSSGRAIFIICISIPLSVVGAFVAMAILGRSLNVISLAGIAFSVGMVVDAAIVILENIFRHKEKGLPLNKACYLGTIEVWKAVLVSVLTTCVVFLPVLITTLEIGYLFRDIAVAITMSVLLSLLVSITVIPSLSSFFLKKNKDLDVNSLAPKKIQNLAKRFSGFVMNSVSYIIDSKKRCIFVISSILASSILIMYFLIPAKDYLPNGNQNFVVGQILPPPGYNKDTLKELGRKVEEGTKPLWTDVSDQEKSSQDKKIKDFFFVAFNQFAWVGAAAKDPQKVMELNEILKKPTENEPGIQAFFFQPSIFGSASQGSSRNLQIDISGDNITNVLTTSQQIFGRTMGYFAELGDKQFQLMPSPSLELEEPQIEIIPDRDRLSLNGLNSQQLAESVAVQNFGLPLLDVTINSKLMKLVVKGKENSISQTQDVKKLSIVTSSGDVVPLETLADVELTSGPTKILREDGKRTISLLLYPSPSMALNEALHIINNKIIDQMRSENLIPKDVSIEIKGTAGKLTQAWDKLILDFGISLFTVYLLMVVLFQSFRFPLIILFSVPLATLGGFIGLKILSQFTAQNLDVLTMLGFVILIGIVVNNAILIVHQTLQHIKDEKMSPHNAILEATQNRLRPIFMSSLTSIFGMLPLVLFPGEGSELYRGLGVVVVGGLTLSSFVTLIIIPPLLKISLLDYKVEKI